MNTKIITDVDGFLAIREDWERLTEQDPDATYYSTFEFNYFWWQTFGSGCDKQLFILCHYRDNMMVAIAPLMIRCIDKKIVKCRVLSFLGKGDYFNFIIDSSKFKASALIRELFHAIEENSEKWDKIELTHLQMNTQLLQYIMRHDRYSKHTQYLTTCNRINSGDFESYEQFEKEMINTKLRRKRVKLRQDTGYRFKIVRASESDDIYEQIANIHQLEKKYLHEVKGRTERGSLFEDKANETFLRELFKGNDRILFFYLESEDSEIIMYKCCYLYRDVLYGWNTGYSPKYSNYHGISDVLLMEMIESLFSGSCAKQIDFGAGTYPWKFRWANHFSVSYSFVMWNECSQQTKLLRLLNQSREIIRAVKELKNAL
ncbi:GNAT family N-acetyltransferase [Paenibacillus donghaensis]|uniref:GNAT family N-acetyltransferase n=1 Tax=Paenibacillus donghaensis TaxID=414771 RepID=UPI00188459B6|nr:GNAT family N-acetyltransferase [Paenibacillus donghaensis]MBE9913887.1 GNAT family N-acetyltransferase [Paenibacillus donghaensis]